MEVLFVLDWCILRLEGVDPTMVSWGFEYLSFCLFFFLGQVFCYDLLVISVHSVHRLIFRIGGIWDFVLSH